MTITHATVVRRFVGGRGHTGHCGPLTVAATPGQSRVESLVVTLRGTMVTQRQPLFRGRRSERDVLDRLLDQVHEGQSAALVIHGEAGVGKTALVRYAVRQASGFRGPIAGVESEEMNNAQECTSSARRCWPTSVHSPSHSSVPC